MMEDIKTIYQLVKPLKGFNHRQRIESFYKGQSKNYDQFRKQLLAGRSTLFQQLHNHSDPNGTWVDFGAGTGASLDFLSDEQIKTYNKIYLVDLSEDLLKKAKEKIAQRQLKNVETVCSDILEFHPPDYCEQVSFSYSLTMVPQWYRILDHSYKILSPEGNIGVVDFYVAEKHPLPGLQQHDLKTRHFWPLWFSHDNVFLNPDHLPYLLTHFSKVHLFEGFNAIPYFPVGKVPYYSFIGKKS